MSRPLYLDDIRVPHTSRDWIIARSCDEAKAHCLEHGVPSLISFDHDLGDQVPSGFDFAKWLVENDMDHHGAFLPEDFSFNVHSANVVGAENITGLLARYLEFRKRQ